MIQSFKCKKTKALFQRQKHKRLPGDLQRVAYRKLVMLHSATGLKDLRVPPGNRLEILKGARKGQHSIRINDQWRICFVWRNANAYSVEIVDYH
ncbi:MAG: type II toxin-antitoxin system RelE/ParE family toxin [Phycisphaerae bacterium]|nr:type II toxin-antitoxin system RelE/ParE family toxin [Phycisphaerae bacterium]